MRLAISRSRDKFFGHWLALASVICSQSRPGCDACCMAHFPQSHRGVRAPRVRVPQDEPVHLNVEGVRVEGLLRKISTTGGLVQLASRLGPGTLAEIAIPTRMGRVQGLVEIFPPVAEGSSSQAFRFIALGDEDHQRLAAIISLMRKQGYVDAAASGF